MRGKRKSQQQSSRLQEDRAGMHQTSQAADTKVQPVVSIITRSKKRVIIISIIVAACVLIGGAYYLFMHSSGDEKQTKSYSGDQYKLLRQENTAPENLDQIVAQYGPEYDAAIVEVENSDAEKWNKAMVDKAHLCLLYANKTNSPAQVNIILVQLNSAARNVDIDDNSWGVSKDDREKIGQKAAAGIKAREIRRL